ncbi:hypothetical protein EKO27_g8559 [Xylaria grammica]|uniref:FAD linked oxidase N-terminal domain-containing protein n=1 Tax=Xylaria grammica TaxID=363999 RepID=A0A439CWE8_9PEZI|nr:hypothetical protein EKO27_g8559 [Xylaria grammica]
MPYGLSSFNGALSADRWWLTDCRETIGQDLLWRIVSLRDDPRIIIQSDDTLLSVTVMSPLSLNSSCSPYTAPSASCTLGNLASYAVNKKDIRVSIKNIGHGYLRRSASKGSLALRTYNLKDISFSNYTSAYYTGLAVKLGAGVRAFKAYKSAFGHGLRVTSPTVGLVGGWVLGGGRGTSSSLYRLGADNNLEYDVVTTEGRHLVASPSENSELFWAMNGGGGDAYAVVISRTTSAHLGGPVAGVEMTFTNTGDDDAYSAAVKA